MMKILIILLLFSQMVRADLKSSLGLSRGNRITFGGDSISHAQMYSNYLIAWLQLSYPELDLETYCIAQSGTSLPGWYGAAPRSTGAPIVSLYEEYHYPFEPDVVFLMHGHNGGQSAADHGATYGLLWKDWVDGESGAKLVMLGMHPSQLATDNKNAEGKADAEAALAATSPRIFASHTFDQMGPRWISNSNNAIDVQQLSARPFSGKDGVHPGPAGHIAIAWAALKGLGAETVVSQATLNAATSTILSTVNCTVSALHLTSSGGTFSRLDAKLPWAIDEAGRTNAVALYPAISHWQDYSITVTGLNEGTYRIACDGVVIGEATAADLSNGWNMADLTSGPVWKQGQDVLASIRELEGFDPVTGKGLPANANAGTIGDIFDWRTVYYVKEGQRGAAYKASMAPKIAALAPKMAAVHAAAQPVTRNYSIESMAPAAPTSGNAWRYAGVPYPDWEYDPFTKSVPAPPTEWPAATHTGYYYVAKDTAGATDTWDGVEPRDADSRRYGYPNKPRLTLPASSANSAAFGEGTVIWIKGGTYPGNPFNGRLQLHGAAMAPVWIYGDPADRPSFTTGYMQIVNSQYFFIENLDWIDGANSNGALTFQSNFVEGDTHHGVIRKCRFINRKYISGGGAIVGVTGNPSVTDGELYDMVFYRNTFKNCGGGYDWSVGDNDHHGFKVDEQQTRKIWIIENAAVPGDTPDSVDGLYKSISGNMVQVGQDNGASQPHNIYIAGNTMSRTRQAGIGIKRCEKTIISGNRISDVNRTTAAGININFNLRPNIWVIGNEVTNCAGGIHLGSESADGNSTYIIGNLCYRNRHGETDSNWRYMSGVSIWDIRGKHYIVNNTFDDQAYGVYFAPRPTAQNADAELHIYNNIISKAVSGVDPDAASIRISNRATSFHLYLENNLFDVMSVYVAGTSKITSMEDLNGRTFAAGNLTGNPMFSAGGPGEYLPKAGSPAIDAGTVTHSTNGSKDVYGVFVDSFSNDPDFPGIPQDVWPMDWEGAARVQGSTIDIGPFERGNPTTTISPVKNLRIIPK